MWYTYTHTHIHAYYYICHSAIKNEILPFVTTCIELGGHDTKWSKSENDKYCIIYLYIWNLKKHWQKQFKYIENKLVIARDEGCKRNSEGGQKVEEKKANTVDI